MHDLTSGLIAILRKYMRDPGASVGGTSVLADLGIDDLDLPMICLDLEDAYGVHIGRGDEHGALETVGDLVARLVAQPCPEGASAPASPAPASRAGCRPAPSAGDRVGRGALLADGTGFHRDWSTLRCIGPAAVRSATSFLRQSGA